MVSWAVHLSSSLMMECTEILLQFCRADGYDLVDEVLWICTFQSSDRELYGSWNMLKQDSIVQIEIEQK